MNSTEITKILVGVMLGMRWLHAAGVIHLDLSPMKILIGQDGLVKICDFGLSRCAIVGVEYSKNAGAPLYRAPEMFGGNDYHQKIDVFAVVMMAYEMMVGELLRPP
jgi:serine/threonine protein kinase